jgi:DNA-binding GntR family transcriptional regulator
MTSVPSSPEAPEQALLTEADRYTQSAMEFFTKRCRQAGLELSNETCEKTRLRLHTGFLFPDLAEWQQRWLVTVSYHRQMLARLVNLRPQALAAPLRAQVEQITARAEQTFMDLVRETRNIIPSEALSAAQQAALEREYLRIEFADAMSG